MSEQIDIDINVNMNNVDEVDDLTSKLQEATAQVDELTNELAEIELGASDADFDAVTSALDDAQTEAEELQSKLDEIDNTTVEPTVNMDSSGIDEANDKLEQTESTTSSLTTALGGLAGVMGVEQMISTADKINNSWNTLKLTFGDTENVLNDLTAKTTEAANATGRSGGQIREYFNNMGIAGIKNTDLLNSSFQSLAGRAYQTQQPIEAMESKMQSMVMTGNASTKMLKGLGLTTEDLAKAMGVSKDEAKGAFEALDQEGRLDAITKAMGDGKQANEMYKNSYAGLKQQAETAMAGLLGAIGQGTLPIITPMIRGATGLIKSFTSSFQGLPGPVQGVVGSLGGFFAIGTATIGALGLLGQVGSGVVGGLRSMKSGYDTVKGAMGTARAMMDALRNSESITQGVRAALAIATGAEATAEGGAAAAKTAAIGPTTGLAIAENSLLLPLLLIVGAVVAVIAVMWYLYNTNETVRNGINWLIAQIQGFVSGLVSAAQGILNFVTQGIANISKLPGAIMGFLLKALVQIEIWKLQLIQYGINAANNFVNMVRNGLSSIGGAIQSALSGVFNFITAPFQQAFNFINDTVIKPLKGAWDWLSSAFSGFEGYSSFESYGSIAETLNEAMFNNTNQTNNSAINNTNNFYGLIEESAADYIISTVNDRLRKEKLLRGS